ncbi:hypothetical protein H5410_051599 [Solanum commersonii]|uniref:Uncharacterized protein n=1 Tax=Solanum commersonii TaxID=4109 RepID=A0A9J5X110_SOLCO|nr:hypothetical protein H5410_051599 [Solanum commersonii]
MLASPSITAPRDPHPPVRNGFEPPEKCQFRRFLASSVTHPFQSIGKSTTGELKFLLWNSLLA